MQRPVIYTLVMLAFVLVAGCSYIDSLRVGQYTKQGTYPIGLTKLYFHDLKRPFDAWNAAHASDSYQAMLSEINAAGEPQIVVAHIWYPARVDGSGHTASLKDFASSKSSFFTDAFEKLFVRNNIQDISGPDLQPDRDIFSQPQLLGVISNAVEARIINASYGANAADGPFPIIIAAHGLGGGSIMWAPFAEYLASHGYIVVAPSFISDGAAPNTLDSPDSAYFAHAGVAGLDRAYQTILGEFKVMPGFYKYLFGYEGEIGFEGPPRGMKISAVSGGGHKVGQMMGELFNQRVGDIQTIIDGLESLNKNKESCLADYIERGQARHGAEVCGMFTATLDLSRIGIMGHSLGSMTAQFASARDDRIMAVVGYNNGPPQYWEPQDIFGNGTAADGQPAGVSKPFLQIHGSEDAFVQRIFRGLMWNTLAAAGGRPEDIWLLEQERVLPTDENPQPIARNAYHRATGDKMIIAVKDVNHGSLFDDFKAVASKRNPIIVDNKGYLVNPLFSRLIEKTGIGGSYGKTYWVNPQFIKRKAVGQDVLNPAFQGEEFKPLNWGEEELVYLPIFIRNFYTKNWFDFYLKGEGAAANLSDNPLEGEVPSALRHFKRTKILDIRAAISPR